MTAFSLLRWLASRRRAANTPPGSATPIVVFRRRRWLPGVRS